MYPDAKIAKVQIIQHYIKMAPRMLEILRDRPVVLTRYPNGVEKEGFYEKDMPMGTPSWVKTFKTYSQAAKRTLSYIICNDLDTLIWLANLAALELHIMLFRTDAPEKPDLLYFDIDPQPPAGTDEVVNVALILKEKLDGLNLKSYVKTSGKRGLHILVPIARDYSFNQTREYVHQIGKHLSRESANITSEFTREKKPGTIYIDYMQNSHGRTMVCPYSLRATPQATVSLPLEWNMVKKGLKPEEFTLFNVAKSKGTPWKGMLEDKQKL